MKRRKPYDDYDSDSTPFSRRLRRSLNNPLRLLHRKNSSFFILGATGNVYTVTLSATPTCDCPDLTNPCKHILFVYIRVLSLPQNDPCLQTRTLSPCQLTRLLSAEVCYEAVAHSSVRRRFREEYRRRRSERKKSEKVEDCGSTCGFCLDEMGVEGVRLVACGACRVRILRWRDGVEEEDEYINLSAYVSEDEDEDDSEDDSMGQDSEMEESSDDEDVCGVKEDHSHQVFKTTSTGEYTQTSRVNFDDTLELGLSLGNNDDVHVEKEPPTISMERDKAKAMAELKGKGIASSTYEDKRLSLLDEMATTNKMMQEAIRSLVELEEKKILFIDINHMTASQRAQHVAYCDMIREKYKLPRSG